MVTTGSSGAFLLAFIAAFDAGARVAMAAPSYPCYRNILQSLDVEVVSVPCGPETRYELTPGHAGRPRPHRRRHRRQPVEPHRQHDRRAQTWRALADWCDGHGAVLISDEIYHGIQYGHAPVTAAAIYDRARS